MTGESKEPAIGFASEADYRRAHEVLVDANFTDEGLTDLLGSADVPITRVVDLPPLLRRTGGGTPLETLTRLFFLGVSVELDAVRRALDPVSLESWAEARLLAVEQQGVVPLIHLRPFRRLLLAADKIREIRSGARSDFVMGVAPSSILLIQAGLRREMGRTLDLGTGCGVAGLLASHHSDHVVATDKNPRAVDFARFNARLNGIDNVEARVGELFEPVGGQQYDSVICNPPYVIAPDTRYLFRDSGRRGDEFCRSVIREAPGVLAENGFCHVVCNWPYGGDQSWRDGLNGWFDDLGCDVMVFGGEMQTASQYATRWIEDTESGAAEEFPRLYDTWMSYFEQEGIESISYGIVVLRRRSGQGQWIRLVDAPESLGRNCGDDIVRRFRLQDYVQSMPDEGLLDETFRHATSLRLEQSLRPAEGQMSIEKTTLRLVGGLAASTPVDTNITQLILRVDGRKSLRTLFEEMSAALQVRSDQLVPGGLQVVRELVQQGYLLPSCLADEPGGP